MFGARSPLAKLFAALLALGLIATACGSDSEGSDTNAAAEAVEAAPAVEEAAEEPMTEEVADIVGTAVGTGDFPTLVAAVEAAGLVETLQGEGPFTVFAPTEDAFAAALEALGLTAEELLADTETLTAVLTYHVVPGNVAAADVVGLDGENVATVNGAEIAIAVDGETVKINEATVTATDVVASNGIIHVIDTVLLPPS